MSNGTTKGSFTPAPTNTSLVKGTFKHTVKRHGERQDLAIKLKVNKGGIITPENVDTGIVKAMFDDGIVCEFEADDNPRRFFEYSLKLRMRDGVLEEKDGNCYSAQSTTLSEMPSHTSNMVSIGFDDDDNPNTPDILIGEFKH